MAFVTRRDEQTQIYLLDIDRGAFLNLTASDHPTDPTLLDGTINIDLMDPQGAGGDGLLTISEIGGAGLGDLDDTGRSLPRNLRYRPNRHELSSQEET